MRFDWKLVSKIVLFVVITSLVPLLFNCIFISENKSQFWFIQSSMSVSDWFGFWMSYISVLVSSVLAYAALKLSNSIEYSHFYDKCEQDKMLFQIESMEIKIIEMLHQNLDFEIEVVLSQDVQMINQCDVERAEMLFSNGRTMELEFKGDASLDGNTFVLVPPKEIEEDTGESFLHWLLWEQQLTPGFETIQFIVTYTSESKFNFNMTKRRNFISTIRASYTLKTNAHKLSIVDVLNSRFTLVEVKTKTNRG